MSTPVTPGSGQLPADVDPNAGNGASASACSHCGAAANEVSHGAPTIALVGAPNAGKSTLFNALTGAGATMGNYPGTTVEISRGVWHTHKAFRRSSQRGTEYNVIDFPGAYSLDPMSPDEALTSDLLLHNSGPNRPDLIMVAVDTSNIARGLYLAAQIAEHPYRVVVVLTKGDVAQRQGLEVDADALSRSLGMPVVAIDPRRRDMSTLAETVAAELQRPARVIRPVDLAAHAHLEGNDLEFAAADARFEWIDDAVAAATVRDEQQASTTEKIDRFVLHPVLGPVIFLAAMWLVFQITTTVAAPFQTLLEDFFTGPVSSWGEALLTAVGLDYPFMHGLLIDGIINGVGMVLTFVPLMALMFLCLAVLEDSGYMARAAVVADRVMRAIGLPGKAFIPLIVGFGCNVPAISATRVLGSPQHRRMTALLVPFTSCSARLTVYVMLANTFFPDHAGTVVFAMYVVSILLVVLSGLLLKNLLWRTMGADPLVIDLPVYQWPTARLSLSVMWARLRGFLQTAGGIIVATVVAIWFLQSTPAVAGHTWGDEELAPQDSVYGVVSDAIAPVFEPAGFGSWSLTGPLITGFLAKEALISTWAQTYALEDPSEGTGQEQGESDLARAVRADFDQTSGGHPIAAIWAYMIFLMAYTPCVATLAAQRREIGWKWTMLGMVGQLALAWALAVGTFQLLRLFF
ncbi:ferrous iron transport protein B [Corynebacterium sp. TA-R-1]|uniref:Ferrous iron transport protein B n=1 Tax=Corynebacterium stercoris TaxID=2943490 RepID=A0ABT1G4T5_9CORY|nr:ferrous iron transport protein B [Corynebacterium stercoris]MCP1388078.1 ferrous iron transport protein B [Corynebacterium stercoris]